MESDGDLAGVFFRIEIWSPGFFWNFSRNFSRDWMDLNGIQQSTMGILLNLPSGVIQRWLANSPSSMINSQRAKPRCLGHTGISQPAVLGGRGMGIQLFPNWIEFWSKSSKVILPQFLAGQLLLSDHHIQAYGHPKWKNSIRNITQPIYCRGMLRGRICFNSKSTWQNRHLLHCIPEKMRSLNVHILYSFTQKGVFDLWNSMWKRHPLRVVCPQFRNTNRWCWILNPKHVSQPGNFMEISWSI